MERKEDQITNSETTPTRQVIAVDLETGEVIDGAKIQTPEQLAAQKKYAIKQAAIESLKAGEKEKFINYLFTNYKNLADLKPQTAIRLVYLSTYLEYDSDFLKNHGECITREKMQSLMCLKDNTFKSFLAEVTEKGYIIKENKKYRLNSQVFTKGKIELHEPLSDKRFIRIYRDSVRKLYIATPQNKHVYLGYIFQLIPYVNRQYNIICFNPLEENREQIIPMTVGDFCDIIGYDRSHASRLMNIYRDIKFEWRGKEQVFCGYFYEPKKADMRFFVNPFIFFAGDDYHKVEILEFAFT